jgi:uncharacterized protein
MFAGRAQRERPHLDDKVLASWNGLMLGAMARGSIVLGDEKYRKAAERNAAFARTKLWDAPKRTLYHRWRDGERDNVELLEGYAFLLSGMLDLYEATLEPGHLEFAVELAESMVARFYDSENGGFWQTVAGAQDLILRVKPDYDGAEPSGNSVAVLSLLRLGQLTGRGEFTDAARKSLRAFESRLLEVPQALPCMLQAVDFSIDEPFRVVIAGDPAAADTRELMRAVHSVFQPNKIVLGTNGVVEPFAKTLASTGPARAYLCAGTACQPPTSSPAELAEMLSEWTKTQD